MNVKRTKTTGFTLVEILIALAVVAVLAALLLAAFSRVREAGHSTICQSNLKQLALGMQQYVQDYNGRYPIQAGWEIKILPYVKDEKLFMCPSNYRKGVQDAKDSDYGYNFKRLMKITGNQAEGRHETTLPNISSVFLNYDLVLNDNYIVAPGSCGNVLGVNIRHLGGSNFSFLDGHVKWLNAEQFSDVECSLGEPNMRN